MGAAAGGWGSRMEAPGVRGEPWAQLRPVGHFLGSIKQLHERVAQECSEYRALYERMVLPPDVGPGVDWARVLEQKQVRSHPQSWRRLKELEVTPSSNHRATQSCLSSGADACLELGAASHLGREWAEATVQSGKASCRWEGSVGLG